MTQRPYRDAALRILIADDNADSRLLVHTFLSLIGYEVCSAADGREAVACAERFQPDVVFLDLWMPEMDGIEACLRMRDGPCPRPVPIFAVTADLIRAEQIPACFDRVLIKPIDLDWIASLVSQRAAGVARGAARLH
jgi:CheY-like chemotaxis protein